MSIPDVDSPHSCRIPALAAPRPYCGADDGPKEGAEVCLIPVENSSGHPMSLLGTLEEISRLVISHVGDPTETLTNIAHLIQDRFRSDVCSVYLLQPDRLHLVLSATVGLRRESVGKIRMRLTEGLVGLVAELLRPQIIAEASLHPRYRHFPEAGEDQYQTFLGVPIIDRGLLVGVLVVQTRHSRLFTADEVAMVATAAGQLAPIVSDARLAREVHLQEERLRVVRVTMRTVQDIVNNCLNQLQLLRLEAEGHVPPDTLAHFDNSIQHASAKLKALGDVQEFAERPMASGSSIDYD